MVGDATESLFSKKLSVDKEEGKRLSDIEWGIDDLIIIVDDKILFVWSCPLIWSIVGLLALFSC